MKYSLLQLWELFKEAHSLAEESVSDREGSYRSLPLEALLTSPEDAEILFSHPSLSGTFVDLGCASGFLPLAYKLLHPEAEFSIGIEWENSRLSRARELLKEECFTGVKLLSADLRTCAIPDAAVYFLYFPTGPVLDRVLDELRQKSHHFKLLVIESHGDLLPRLAFESWLELVEEVELRGQRHYPFARVYRKLPDVAPLTFTPFLYSFRDHYLELEVGNERWLGDTLDLEWIGGDSFNLKHPPRTIQWSSVKKLMPRKELSEELSLLVELRRRGEVGLWTREGFLSGALRKIILSPVFSLELSGGEKVEWQRVLSISSVE